MEIHQDRAICTARQVEHHNLHCSCVVSAIAHLAAHHPMANVQQMFWRSHLVSHALRPSHALHAGRLGLFLPCSGSHDQHPADENGKHGPQRARLGFANVLLFASNSITLCK